MKRSILLFIAAALCLLLCFVACQKTPTAELSVSQNEYTVQASGGSVNVSVSSNVDLTVRISAGWITQAGGPSSGGGTYSFNVAHNDGYDARTATITFSNGEQGVSETVTITQSQQDAIIPGSLEYQLFYEAQTFSLPVSANVDCSVSVSGGDWIKSLGTRGLTTKQYQFSIAENTGKTPREAVVTITSGSLKQSIKVVQLPTTHLPETDTEIEKSVGWTNKISDRISVIKDSLSSLGKASPEIMAEHFKHIDNVIVSEVINNGSTIALVQRDGIVLNIFLEQFGPDGSFGSRPNRHLSSASSSAGIASQSIDNRIVTRSDVGSEGMVINKRGKALILCAVQVQYDPPVEEWKETLSSFFDKVDVLTDADGKEDITKFKGDYLDQYDFILIYAHGGIGYYSLNTFTNWWNDTWLNNWFGEDHYHDVVNGVFIMQSTTRYSSEAVKKYIKSGVFSWEQIALTKVSESHADGFYLAMTPAFLKDASFDDSFVILNSCNSANETIWSGPGSMKDAFFNAGAAFYSGYETAVNPMRAGYITEHVLNFIGQGISLEEASEYWDHSDVLKTCCEAQYAFWEDQSEEWHMNGSQMTKEEALKEGGINLFAPLKFKANPSLGSVRCFLFSPYPELKEPNASKSPITLEWNSNLASFTETVQYVEYSKSKHDFSRNEEVECPQTVTYDVFVKGKDDNQNKAKKIEDKNPSDKSATWTPTSNGDYTWYVVANVRLNEGKVISYKSNKGTFTITGPSIPVTGIRLTPSTITLEEGQSSQLTATVYPANATNKKVIWSSNYPESVSVDENGLITAIKRRLGVTIIITAKTEDGEKTATCRVYVNESTSGKVAVTGISLGQSSAELKVGDVLQLNATVAPSNATDKTVTWSSSNNSVATVSSSGLVSAKSEGTAKITAKTEDGGKTATVTITVKKADAGSVSVTGVSLDKSSISLKVGESETLKATVSPTNATNKGLTWTSSMSSVATVTSDGVVTAKAAGTATITVKTDDGGKTATCNVTVTYNGDPGGEISVSQVTISPTTANMTVGDTKQFSVKVDPANATNQEVSWSSSEPSVASVDSKGMVTAKAEGKATITVTAKDGGVSSKATVTVSNKVVPVTGVTVSPTSLTMEIGDSKPLTVTVNPSDATDKTYTVSSDNTGVVEIDKGNNVVAKGAGTANVTVTTTDGAQTATCKVTVNKPQMTIEASPTSLSFGNVNVGESSTKTFTISNTGKAEVKVSGISVPTAFGTDASTPFTIAVGKSQTINVTFTPTDGKDYSGTITISSDADSQPTVSVSGKGVKQSSSDTFEAVDLGLSVKWANMNLGATKPEEYGDYYAWGETEPYYISQNPLTWKDGKESGYYWSSYKWFKKDTYLLLTKYCLDSDYGYNQFIDGKTVLDPEDDAAHIHLGDKWRMPTDSEFTELLEKCTWTWTTDYNGTGIAGRVVTSNVSGYAGKQIFFPAAGCIVKTSFSNVGSRGYYWSSTLDDDAMFYGWSLFIMDGFFYRRTEVREYGMPIRAVSE